MKKTMLGIAIATMISAPVFAAENVKVEDKFKTVTKQVPHTEQVCQVVDVPISEGISTYKVVDRSDPLIETALALGVYVGDIEDGLFDGKGYFLDVNGNIEEGDFKQGNIIGEII